MKKLYIILFFLLGVHLFILSRLQFTAWPEMVSFPYLINHGFVTYRDMVHAYPPLLINILAVLYSIFGYKLLVLKIFGWISIIFSDILIFILIKRTTKKEVLAIGGVFIYVILQSLLEGNMVWPDLAMIPFLLLGTLFLISETSHFGVKNKYLFSGVIFGLAVLTKQTGFLYMLGGILYIILAEKNIRKLVSFLAGSLIVFVPFVLSLIFQKSFVDFFNWTIIYPSAYWTRFLGYVNLNPTFRENLILLVLFLPVSYLVFSVRKKIFADRFFLLLFAFLICGVLGVYPRFSFFHFQPALPFLIILCVYLLSKTKLKIYFLFLIPVFVLLVSFRDLQFRGNRFWEDGDLALAKTIQNETVADSPIYLLGLNSSLYAFSDRLPNKPWMDNFGWYLEIPGVQEDVINGFEKNHPEAVFWAIPQRGSWYDIGVYQPRLITDWIEKNYNMDKEVQRGILEWIRR